MAGRERSEVSFTYAPVGGTTAPDLVRNPPSGYRSYSHRVRIGDGRERWDFACAETLSWGIQRRSGFRVEIVEQPDAAARDSSESSGGERVAPAMIVRLLIPLGPFGWGAPCRVVYVFDETDRKGFAYGTLPGHPESGEAAFFVDRESDGSVWITVSAFSRPSSWLFRLGYPFLRLVQWFYVRRYLRSLVVVGSESSGEA